MNSYPKLIRIVKCQEGQILPWFALMLIVFTGFTALVVDIGRGDYRISHAAVLL